MVNLVLYWLKCRNIKWLIRRHQSEYKRNLRDYGYVWNAMAEPERVVIAKEQLSLRDEIQRLCNRLESISVRECKNGINETI